MVQLSWTHKWHSTKWTKKLAREIGTKNCDKKSNLKNYAVKVDHKNDNKMCTKKKHSEAESNNATKLDGKYVTIKWHQENGTL